MVVVHIYTCKAPRLLPRKAHLLLVSRFHTLHAKDLHAHSSSHRASKLFLLMLIYTLSVVMGFPSSLSVLPSPLALLPPAFNSRFANLLRHLQNVPAPCVLHLSQQCSQLLDSSKPWHPLHILHVCEVAESPVKQKLRASKTFLAVRTCRGNGDI